MIIDTETKRKPREMNVRDLLDAFGRLDEQAAVPLSHTEVIRLAVDSAHSGHMDAKIQRLVKRAGLRYPQADLRTIDLVGERRLDRSTIASLDAGNYPGQRLNVVFQGATGEPPDRASPTCYARWRNPRAGHATARSASACPTSPNKSAWRRTGRAACPSSCANTPPTTCSPSTNGSSTSPTSHSNDSHPGSWSSATTRPAPRNPRPHRAQHDMDRHRRIQHETTPRANHARTLTPREASGLEPIRHWPPSAITMALKDNNQWP